jgi:hypothetical protein
MDYRRRFLVYALTFGVSTDLYTLCTCETSNIVPLIRCGLRQ